MTTQTFDLVNISDAQLQAAAAGKRHMTIAPAQVINAPIVIGNVPSQPLMPSFPFSDSKNSPTFPAFLG